MKRTGRKRLFHTEVEDFGVVSQDSPFGQTAERIFKNFYGNEHIVSGSTKGVVRTFKAEEVIVHTGKSGEKRESIHIGKKENGY